MIIFQREFLTRYNFQALARPSASSDGLKSMNQALPTFSSASYIPDWLHAGAEESASTFPFPTPVKEELQEEEHAATGSTMQGSAPS